MKLTYTLFAICLVLSLRINAQVQFSNHNDLLQEHDLHSAVPVGIADMNGDGLDDIISLNGGTDLLIQYQTPDPSRPFVYYEVQVALDANEQNDICIADFNNDGANDILTVGSYDRVKVLYSIPFTYTFDLTHITVTPFFSQGASTGDFNHDGWVDVVLLNDNGLNYTLMNDGTGTLDEQDLFDFVTVPSSDNSGNYGSLYTDFDMDGDLDFYIAKCRQGVNNPADPRRIDVLYENDGLGNYTENAAQYGLADGHQTWTADFGDIDNDGDLDLFKTQHDIISELLENIDNDTFINITPSSGLNIGGVPLQGMFRDFDNDGFQDILVSGDRVDFYRNNGDKTFTREEPFGGTIFGTFALGDLNQDGFTDVYASTVIPFNNPDFLRDDILFMNETNGNHFLSVTLEDNLGNRSAIGAMALLYGPWGTQVREVRGGEQYGISNSHGMVFGLGQETAYDSLVIRWPDGTREVYSDLEVDKVSHLIRGGCRILEEKHFPALSVLCNNDSLTLKVEPGFTSIIWSTGEISDSIVVKEAGLYYAELTYLDECITRTLPVEVITDPDSVRPAVIYDGNPLLCNGDIAFLSVSQGVAYQWSNGETTQNINALEAGDYFALVEGFCKVQQSDTVHLEFFSPDIPLTTPDTFQLGETVLLIASGDSIEWFADPLGEVLIGTGDSLMVENLTDTTIFYAGNLKPIEGQDFQVGPVTQSGANKYNANFVNGGLLFEVHEPIVLHQITVYTDSVGTRIIEITNGNDFFFEYQADLDSGTTILDLEIELPVGAFTIGTNTDLNNLVFGVNSPYLWRSSSNILYPYEIAGVFSITNSTFGEDFYYYFYDWKISTTDKYCSSDLVPVSAVLDLGTAVEDPNVQPPSYLVTPNPSDGLFTIRIEKGGPLFIEVSNTEGKRVLSQKHAEWDGEGVSIDLSSQPAGIYCIRLVQNGNSYTHKIIRL